MKRESSLKLAEYDFIPEGGTKPYNQDPAKLKEWRTILGLTQAELAKRAGVSQGIVQRIENESCAFVDPSRTLLWNTIEALANGRTKELMETHALEYDPRNIWEMAAALLGKTSRATVSMQEQIEIQRGMIETLQGLLEAARQSEKAAIAKERWAWDKINSLLDILNLKTIGAVSENEAQAKIKALGLEERSQVEEEFRSELAARHERTRKKP